MKRFFIIFLLGLYLLANTELRELTKLGAFVTHYLEHKELSKDISLFTFIEIHYLHGDTKDSDYDRDMQLPFKTHDCSNHSTQIINFLSSINYNIFEPVFCIENNSTAYEYVEIPSSYLADIWQPPRVS